LKKKIVDEYYIKTASLLANFSCFSNNMQTMHLQNNSGTRLIKNSWEPKQYSKRMELARQNCV